MADKFLVFTHCLSGFWLVGIGFSVRLRFQCGWCGCSVVGLGPLGVTSGVFLVHCVLCCAGGFYLARWRGLMDDETSSHYVFLFMLLLIPFLVIGLSIKANIYKYMCFTSVSIRINFKPDLIFFLCTLNTAVNTEYWYCKLVCLAKGRVIVFFLYLCNSHSLKWSQ